jgi:hypothetical protein
MPDESERALEESVRHVVEGRGIVGRQLARIAGLKALGLPIEHEKEMLRSLESTLCIMEEDLERNEKV